MKSPLTFFLFLLIANWNSQIVYSNAASVPVKPKNSFVAGPPLTESEFNSQPHYSPLTDSGRLSNDVFETHGKFQGDIDLDDQQSAMAKNSVINRQRLWPNATIPYVISDIYTDAQRQVIASGMNEYHKYTCIRFVPRSDEEDYIQIESNDGCSSLVGRIGRGLQTVSIDINGCVYTDTVQHELMHAAGFHHEQSRYDRDDYVTIYWDNIPPSLAFNFVKIGPDVIRFLGTLYDYKSVMHYRSNAFAIDPSQPTIVANDGTLLGNNQFSDNDILKLNRMYSCNPNDTCWDEDVRVCPSLVADGLCENDPQEAVVNCKFSCGFCSFPDCFDEDSVDCQRRAGNGECLTNPDIMLTVCKRSCKSCVLGPQN